MTKNSRRGSKPPSARSDRRAKTVSRERGRCSTVPKKFPLAQKTKLPGWFNRTVRTVGGGDKKGLDSSYTKQQKKGNKKAKGRRGKGDKNVGGGESRGVGCSFARPLGKTKAAKRRSNRTRDETSPKRREPQKPEPRITTQNREGQKKASREREPDDKRGTGFSKG